MANTADEAFVRLSQVLDVSEEPENEYRHELASVRQRARGLAAIAAELAADGVEFPDYVSSAANALAVIVRDRPGSASEIQEALKELSVDVATLVSLARGSGREYGQAQRRSQEAAATAEAGAAEIERLLDGARRLVGQYADDQLATHYRSGADLEGKSADRWRHRTIIGFATTLALTLTTAILAVFADREFEELVSTGGLSVALGGLTAYLSSQARLHRDRETSYRDAELKLAVIAPMIASIEPAARDAVRSEVVRLLFADSGVAAPSGSGSGRR